MPPRPSMPDNSSPASTTPTHSSAHIRIPVASRLSCGASWISWCIRHLLSRRADVLRPKSHAPNALGTAAHRPIRRRGPGTLACAGQRVSGSGGGGAGAAANADLADGAGRDPPGRSAGVARPRSGVHLGQPRDDVLDPRRRDRPVALVDRVRGRRGGDPDVSTPGTGETARAPRPRRPAGRTRRKTSPTRTRTRPATSRQSRSASTRPTPRSTESTAAHGSRFPSSS